MFCALLVELGYFETVTVGFLIVGHTHASIDQYFGCLRNLIGAATFIASPIALHHLFSIQPKSVDSSYRPPILQLRIHYVHNYKAFFGPYWNNNIKHYQIPYQFKFFNFCGKAVCQYKQFSDPNLKWLPVLPAVTNKSFHAGDFANRSKVYIFEDNLSLTSAAGKAAFMKHVGIPEQSSSKNLLLELLGNKKDEKLMEKINLMHEALPTLIEKISLKAMHEQELRRIDEENGITDIKRYDVDPALLVQKNLESTCTNEAG